MSCPLSSFVAGVKIGSGNCSHWRSPGGSGMPQICWLSWYSLHPRALEVAADNTFDRHDIGLFDNHRPAVQYIVVDRRRQFDSVDRRA